jgi:hypothetical protein
VRSAGLARATHRAHHVGHGHNTRGLVQCQLEPPRGGHCNRGGQGA